MHSYLQYPVYLGKNSRLNHEILGIFSKSLNQLVVGIINNIFEDHFGCNTINYFTTLEDQIVEQFYLARLIQFESFFSYKKWGNPY